MTLHSLLRRNVIIGTVLFATALVFMHGLVQPASADEMLRQAREAKVKAMHASCETIGKKVSTCYSGDHDICGSLQESIAWFSKEYGQYPELACSTDATFFLTGAKP
jgi:hypothetical protein